MLQRPLERKEDGGRWFDFWNGRAGTDRFIYYGGRFNDRDGTLAGAEQHRGEPSSRAFSTGNVFATTRHSGITQYIARSD